MPHATAREENFSNNEEKEHTADAYAPCKNFGRLTEQRKRLLSYGHDPDART